MGTVAYMSPEQVLGKALDARTDVFSLGVVLYEMATRTRPFGGETTGAVYDAILHEPPTPPLRLNPALPAELERVIDKCLEKDKDLRYQSASELLADLKRVKRDTTSADGASALSRRGGRRAARALPWLGAAALAVAGSAWWLASERPPRAPAGPVRITPFAAEAGSKQWPQLSPDGEKVAYVWDGPDGDGRGIYVKALGVGTRPLRLTEAKAAGEFSPVWSPDGRQIAFVRSGSGRLGDWDVWVQRRGEAAPRRLTRQGYDACRSPVWTPDGSEILFTTGWGDLSIQRVRLAGGEPQPVFGVGAAFPSVRGSRAVYQRVTQPAQSIWRAPGRTNPLRDRAPQKLIDSGQVDGNPVYSPDGRKIAFHSDRSGVLNIWVCDADGKNPVQLTSFDRRTGTPRWSPDGRRLLFDSIEAGDWNLYVVDADGGPPRRLTPDPSGENSGTWSRDGRFVYFSSNRGGGDRIWRMSSAGGPATQVTRRGGYYAEESWDGRHVYYANARAAAGIWKVAVEGGEGSEVVGGAPLSFFGNWTLSRSGLYYATILSRGRGNEYKVQHLDFASGRTSEVLRQVGTSEHMWLAVSPDEQWILYSQWPEAQSELMLVENFR